MRIENWGVELMEPIKKPRIKICCITSAKEAWLAIKYGASAVGLVSEMPSGPGPISEELIDKITKTLPPFFSAFFIDFKTGSNRNYCTAQTVSDKCYTTH